MGDWNYNPEDARRCWKAGEYRGHMVDCEYKTSSGGNEMAAVKIKVYDGDRSMTVMDWIVNHPDMIWKLKHLARACGSEDEFKSGEFRPHHAMNETLVVKLTEENDEKYGEQNRIADYKAPASASEGSSRRSSVPVGDIPDDDDIPFD